MNNPDIQAQLDLLEANMVHEIACGGDEVEAALRFGEKATALLLQAYMNGYDVSGYGLDV